MDWLSEIGGIWMAGAWWWVGFCAAFLILTRFCPCNPGQNWWTNRRAAVTDMVYWLLMPLVGQLGRALLLVLGVALLYGNAPTQEFALRSWPVWAQCIAILLLQDAMMYVIHRIFHTRWAWRFHAVHHSSETVDWTSAVRFHPVNLIAEFALADAVILLMGFDPLALAVLGPFNLIYSVMVHANLNWTFGPLRYVFASPVFHRWHHTAEEEGLDKNFAPTFPFLDWMFGTFYMPGGRRPEVYGTNSTSLPAGFVGQTIYPFRKPIPAIAGLAALVALGVFGWHQMNKPLDVQDVAQEMAERPAAPPELLRMTQRNPNAASAVAANAAGGRLIYGASDGSVSIRDVTTGQALAAERHPARVNAVAISPNGMFGVSASGDGTVKVFRTENGATLHNLGHAGQNVMAVAVSDDGWVATGTVEGTLRLWNAQGEPAKTNSLQTASIQAVAVSAGGSHVVAARNSHLSVWETNSDRVVQCEGIKNLAYCVAIRADGGQVAVGEYDGRLHLWEPGRGAATVVAGHTGPIYSVAFVPESDTVMTGGADHIVRVWNAKNGTVVKQLDGHSGLVFSVSCDPATQRVLAAGKDLTFTGWNLVNDAIVPTSATQRE